jgi:hypothetical protein
MTHIRRRITKAGSTSTALVESYRNENGQPRQRLIANLHGEPDTLSALARLEFQLNHWRNRRDKKRAEGTIFSKRSDIVFGRFLATIEDEISTIKKHCSATSDEIDAAIKAHEFALDDAVITTQAAYICTFPYEDQLKAAEAKLRRMRV